MKGALSERAKLLPEEQLVEPRASSLAEREIALELNGDRGHRAEGGEATAELKSCTKGSRERETERPAPANLSSCACAARGPLRVGIPGEPDPVTYLNAWDRVGLAGKAQSPARHHCWVSASRGRREQRRVEERSTRLLLLWATLIKANSKTSFWRRSSQPRPVSGVGIAPERWERDPE